MNRALRTAATGMVAQQNMVDTLANNIANVNTHGFKKNRLTFSSLLYQTLREPGAPTAGAQRNPTGLQLGSGVETSGSLKIFEQGDLEPTSSKWDMAIGGEGFFKVAQPNGEFRYTRNGSFRLDGNGALVTVEGYKLEPTVTIPEGSDSISISVDGQVSALQPGETTPAIVGQIGLTRFPNPAGLKATGNNMFRETASSGAPVDSNPGDTGTGIVQQHFLERSNVSVVDELIELIEAQRNYEVNSRTIQVANEMLQQAGNLIR